MAKYSTSAVHESLAECSGLFVGCLQEWRQDRLVLLPMTHLVPLGPHIDNLSGTTADWMLDKQEQGLMKMFKLLDQLEQQREVWSTNSDWYGPIIHRSPLEWLEDVARDMRFDRAAKALLVFGAKRTIYETLPVNAMHMFTRGPNVRFRCREPLASMLDLLLESMAGAAEAANESIASIDPRSGKMLKLLQWWREAPDEEKSHAEVHKQYLLNEGWTPQRLKGPLPKYSTDPVHPFLSRYCRKLGEPQSRANWVLRESAKGRR